MLKSKIVEPIYTIIKISCLNFYPDNTKISIHNNVIKSRLPTSYQGIIRWGYGEDRTDIKYIEQSILFGLKILENMKIDYKQLVFSLYSGINKLTLCYVDDNKYKLLLQNLEQKVKSLFETGKLDNCKLSIHKGDYNYNTIVDLWSKNEIKFINDNFKIINSLYKLDKTINFNTKREIREHYVVIIKQIMNLKNENFKMKCLSNVNFY